MSGYAPQFCIFHFAFLITERFVMERAEKSIEINAPVKVVFDLYSDFENFPKWMKHIKEVRRTGENYTRWAADAPLGINVEWEPLEQLYADVGLPPRLPMVAWRTSVPLYQGPDQVGYATSGCWSPLLKRYIALAHVPAAYGSPGTPLDMEVTVEHKRKRAAARVVPLPFFDPARKKA